MKPLVRVFYEEVREKEYSADSEICQALFFHAEKFRGLYPYVASDTEISSSHYKIKTPSKNKLKWEHLKTIRTLQNSDTLVFCLCMDSSA